MSTTNRSNRAHKVPPICIVRQLPNSYVNATTLSETRGAIDVLLARRQHEAYQVCLSRMGFELLRVPAENDSPDCVFIEDVATVAGQRLLLHRSGHPGRRCERSGVEATLRAHPELGLDVFYMEAPATADGGDILRVGSVLFVGLSARTNAAGARRLEEVFGPLGYRVETIPLPPHVLHLKCVCSTAGPRHLLLAEGSLAASVFDDLVSIIEVPAAETYAANVVGFNGKVVMARGFPETQLRLEAHGFEVWPIDTSEFRKGDGSLTCLSIPLGSP
jgi:dimethylargininase